MKKTILLFVLSFVLMNAYSQEKKESPNLNPYKFNTGIDLNLCILIIKTNSSVANRDTSIFNAFDVTRFHFDYSMIKRLSIGLSLEHSGLISKPIVDNEYSIDQISINSIGFSIKFKYISIAKSNLYVEVLPVYSWLGIQKQGMGSNNEILSKGFGYQTALGWDQFFGNHLGMSLRFNFSKIKYEPSLLNDIANPQGQTPIYSIGSDKLDCTSFGAGLGFLIRF
jgi:hypothetical protein